MKKLILFPFNGNAQEAVSIVDAANQTDQRCCLLGFIDDNLELRGKEFQSYSILGGRDQLDLYPDAKVLAVPGRPENFWEREKVIDSLGIDEKRFSSLIHPSAQIGVGVEIGYNTLIMAGVVITANVSVGNHCVILPNTVISHDSIIRDYCLIGSNVSISGGVNVERLSYIGSGSKLIQEITIGEKTLVGLGSTVLGSTEPQSIVAGNPAKLLRKAKT